MDEQQLPPEAAALLDPWTQADSNRLRQISAGLSVAGQQVESGILSPQEGDQLRKQLTLLRLPLLARQQQSIQAGQSQQEGQVMKSAALAEGMEAHHDVTRAQAFPLTVAQFRDPMSGQVAHFFPGKRGQWEQIQWAPKGAALEGAGAAEPPTSSAGRGAGAETLPRADLGWASGVAESLGGARPGGEGDPANATLWRRQEQGLAAPAPQTPAGGQAPATPWQPPREQMGPEQPDELLAVRAALTGMSPDARLRLDAGLANLRGDVYQKHGLSAEEAAATEGQASQQGSAGALKVLQEAERLGVDPVELAQKKFQRLRAAEPTMAQVQGYIAEGEGRGPQAQRERERQEVEQMTLSPYQMAHLRSRAEAEERHRPIYVPQGRAWTAADHAYVQRQREAKDARINANVQHWADLALADKRRAAQAEEGRKEKLAGAHELVQARSAEVTAEHQRKEEIRVKEQDAALQKHFVDIALKEKMGMPPGEQMKHARALYDAHQATFGKGGAGKTPPDEAMAKKLRENARKGDQKAILGLMQMGFKPPW